MGDQPCLDCLLLHSPVFRPAQRPTDGPQPLPVIRSARPHGRRKDRTWAIEIAGALDLAVCRWIARSSYCRHFGTFGTAKAHSACRRARVRHELLELRSPDTADQTSTDFRQAADASQSREGEPSGGMAFPVAGSGLYLQAP